MCAIPVKKPFDLSGTCMEGDLGNRASRLVSEWCAERQDELKRAWQLANEGKEIPWILPIQ